MPSAERSAGRRDEPFLSWPGWPLFGHALWLALPVMVAWLLVYYGADWLTGVRAYRVRVHLDVELAIPFAPAFVLAYLSMGFVFMPAPLILRSRRELQALALSLLTVTAVAGVGFLAFPAEVAYAEQGAGAWSRLFGTAKALALQYNLVPSLHVTMSCLCLAAYATRSGVTGKIMLTAWGAVIALSTLFTHQHHLLDVATGLALAAAGKRFVYDRRLRLPPDRQTPCPSPSADRAPWA
jgi:hypothetical protein